MNLWAQQCYFFALLIVHNFFLNYNRSSLTFCSWYSVNRVVSPYRQSNSDRSVSLHLYDEVRDMTCSEILLIVFHCDTVNNGENFQTVSQLCLNNASFIPMEGSWMRGAAVALRLCTRLPSSFRAHTITCWLAETSAAVPLFSPLLSLTTASIHRKNKNRRFWVSSIQRRRSGINASNL